MMQNPYIVPITELTEVDSFSKSLSCPECEGAVYRIHRRWLDVITGLFAPARRYRCYSPACGWEGNVAIKSREQAGSWPKPN